MYEVDRVCIGFMDIWGLIGFRFEGFLLEAEKGGLLG